jgi:hypothetical protein
MLLTVSAALSELKPRKQITWILDSGFDARGGVANHLGAAGARGEPGLSSRPHRAVADRVRGVDTRPFGEGGGAKESAGECAHEDGSEAGQAGSSQETRRRRGSLGLLFSDHLS